MKKGIKIIVLTIVLGAVAALNVKVVLDTNKSYDLTMANIEAISGEHGDGNKDEVPNIGDVSKCDIFIYNREQAETYVSQTITQSMKAKGKITYRGRSIELGVGVAVGATIGIPDCEESKPNCCIKSHIEKSPKYY